jgi:transposase-like protein
MTRRKRIYISREQKEEIIKGLIETNCNIKLLSEKYQVTARTLSKWRSDYY